jgi:hypothetical protein
MSTTVDFTDNSSTSALRKAASDELFHVRLGHLYPFRLPEYLLRTGRQDLK